MNTLTPCSTECPATSTIALVLDLNNSLVQSETKKVTHHHYLTVMRNDLLLFTSTWGHSACCYPVDCRWWGIKLINRLVVFWNVLWKWKGQTMQWTLSNRNITARVYWRQTNRRIEFYYTYHAWVLHTKPCWAIHIPCCRIKMSQTWGSDQKTQT
jgi:hypothetical protein